jgi:hypothetical protein
MQLVGEPRFDRKQNRPLDPYVRAEDVLGPEDAAPVLPVADATTANATLPEPFEQPTGTEAKSDWGAPGPAEPSPPVAVTEVADQPAAEPSLADEVDDSPGEEVQAAESRGDGQGRPSEEGGRNRRRRRGRGPRGPKPGAT